MFEPCVDIVRLSPRRSCRGCPERPVPSVARTVDTDLVRRGPHVELGIRSIHALWPTLSTGEHIPIDSGVERDATHSRDRSTRKGSCRRSGRTKAEKQTPPSHSHITSITIRNVGCRTMHVMRLSELASKQTSIIRVHCSERERGAKSETTSNRPFSLGM